MHGMGHELFDNNFRLNTSGGVGGGNNNTNLDCILCIVCCFGIFSIKKHFNLIFHPFWNCHSRQFSERNFSSSNDNKNAFNYLAFTI